MFFIGDVHALFVDYEERIADLPYSIQLGDMGLGFKNHKYKHEFPVKEGHYFIRGNHDNPEECRKQENYLGDYGFKEPYFFVGGGWSIDRHLRTDGVSWWPEEELTSSQMNDAFDQYKKIKPRCVVSHECPGCVLEWVVNHNRNRRVGVRQSSTTKMFDEMFSVCPPKMWIFAHHHKDMIFDYCGSTFVCVGELSVFDDERLTFIDV